MEIIIQVLVVSWAQEVPVSWAQEVPISWAQEVPVSWAQEVPVTVQVVQVVPLRKTELGQTNLLYIK